MRTYVFAVGGVMAAVIGLAGCSSSKDTDQTDGDTSSSDKTTAQLEIGNTINYGSVGTTTDLDCADGKSLNVGGSNNTLTVKGTCESVRVVGSDNTVTIEKVDKDLDVLGINNTVTYNDGDPNVDDHGSDNKVNKG